MNKFTHTITVFDGDINDVAVLLGECQHYSDKITHQLLSDAGIDIEKDHLNFFQTLKVLKKRKNLTVSFYYVKEKNQIHIYSDFFNLEGAFFETFSFFDNLNNVFMMSEKKNTSLYINLIKLGKRVFQFTVDITDQENMNHNAWQQDYKELCDTISGMPSISDIDVSLKFILKNSSRSDNQMYKYLEENTLFKDEYIL